MNFIAFLSKSNIVNTFLAMVRPAHHSILIKFQHCFHSSHITCISENPQTHTPLELPSMFTTFTPPPLTIPPVETFFSYSSRPQTGPTVGISFCLIIVRLGQVLPGSQEESWQMSIPTSGRTQTPGAGARFSGMRQTDSKIAHSDDHLVTT